jgi:WD40 repeat protein
MVSIEKVFDVFIHYAHTDREWVQGFLVDGLRRAEVTYITKEAFAPGSVRLLNFERAIEQSRYILIVISTAYSADDTSEFVRAMSQTSAAEEQTWPVIPIILQESVELPLGLRALQPLKATDIDEAEAAVTQLCGYVKNVLPSPSPLPDCPYIGMKPFGLGDRERFFGRGQEIKELLEHLRLHPFITVIGPSGSGKSSLVFAGLIPALRESRLFGSGKWRIESIRPGETPETTLRQALAAETPELTRLLLVVDQYEELFTLSKEEAVSFQESLLKLTKTPNTYLVLTVRADFYSDLMTSLLWQEIQNYRLEVLPLNETGLRESILKPAGTVGVFVEAALVERLVTDAAGEPGVLPLIQETLVLLWQRLERHFLPLRAYEAIVLPRSTYGGQEAGQKTGLQVAIARRADQAIKELQDNTKQQQAIARRIFLRLIQFGEGRADTRRQQPVDALRAATDDPTLFEKTLEHLVNCRLLTPSGNDKNSTRKIDIAHEALITGWPELQQWIIERRTKEEVRRRLSLKAEEWARLGRGIGGLLDPVALSEAEAWLVSQDGIDLGYDEVLSALIDSSRAKIKEEEHQKQEEERQKQEQVRRELQLTQDRLKEEKKARRSLQGMLVAVGLAGIVSIGTAIYMFRQSVNNKIETITSHAESLLTSNKDFDALIEELKAGKLAKQWSRILKNETDVSVAVTLQQSLYKVKERNRLLQHSLAVNGVSFSPDGKLIVSGSEDSNIILWNKDGSIKKIFSDNDSSYILDVSFSPNNTNQIIATSSRDNTVKLWSPEGLPLMTLTGHREPVKSLSFSRDSGVLASASLDGTVKLWNVQNGKLLKSLKFADPQKGIIPGAVVALSTDGSTLAVSIYGGEILIWRLNTKVNKKKIVNDGVIAFDFIEQPKIKAYNQNEIAGISFSPNDGKLASIGENEIVKIWNLSPNNLPISLIKTLKTEQIVSRKNRDWDMRIVFSPDGKTLASNTNNSDIRLWNLTSNTSFLLRGHSNGVTSLNFSPDGNMLASGAIDNSIRLWDITSNGFNLLPSIDENTTVINFDPLTERAVFKNDTNGIIVEDINTNSTLQIQNSNTVQSVAFSPDGKRIADADNNHAENSYTVRVWSSEGSRSCILNEHHYSITGINFSLDSKYLISTGESDSSSKENNIALLWDVKSCEKLSTLSGHQNKLTSASFSPNNNLIATSSADSTSKLWERDKSMKSVKLIATLKHNDQVNDVSFSPDSQKIVTASSDSTIKLWNRMGQQVLPPLKGHIGKVNSAVFSPDGRLIVSGGLDGTVKIWSNNGQQIKSFKVGNNEIKNLGFSSNSKFLFISTDKTVTQWNLDLSNNINQGCQWLRDYLENSTDSDQEIVHICNNL